MPSSSQDAAATDQRGGVCGGGRAPGNCAITCRARTTRQSQLLLTDIRLMIVCRAARTLEIQLRYRRARLWCLRHGGIRVEIA